MILLLDTLSMKVVNDKFTLLPGKYFCRHLHLSLDIRTPTQLQSQCQAFQVYLLGPIHPLDSEEP